MDVEVVIECTGRSGRAFGRPAGRQRRDHLPTGIMNVEPQFDVDATTMNRNAVLRNLVLFGTVNAGRRHWEQAVDALATADPDWLRG